jgi:hypothetical protein
MGSIEPLELLSVQQKLEERGAIETADRGLMLAWQVYGYGLPTADTTQRNVTEGLQKRLMPPTGARSSGHRGAAAFRRTEPP